MEKAEKDILSLFWCYDYSLCKSSLFDEEAKRAAVELIKTECNSAWTGRLDTSHMSI